MPSLFILTGDHAGRWFAVGSERLVVGRGKSLAARVRDEEVSRTHLEICYDAGRGCHIAGDLASANGTRLNGHRMHDPTALLDGTVIRIGKTWLIFVARDFAGASQAAEHFDAHIRERVGRLTQDVREGSGMR